MEPQSTHPPRKPRSDRGARLTTRDMRLLTIIGEQYALRFDQVQRWLGLLSPRTDRQTARMLSDSATRHTIDRWEAAGLVVFKKLLADTPGSCWLTSAGLRAAGLPFRTHEPAPAQLAHIYWCAQVRLFLAAQRPAWTWRSERWQRTATDQHKQGHIPDAILHTEAGEVAIEIELTRKDTTRLADMLRERALVYAHIWYFTTENTKAALETARAELEPVYQGRLRIYTVETIA